MQMRNVAKMARTFGFGWGKGRGKGRGGSLRGDEVRAERKSRARAKTLRCPNPTERNGVDQRQKHRLQSLHRPFASTLDLDSSRFLAFFFSSKTRPPKQQTTASARLPFATPTSSFHHALIAPSIRADITLALLTLSTTHAALSV